MSGALSNSLRNELGNVIVEARRVAEAGAKKALESLAVQRHEPHGSTAPEQRLLRNRLRARGRQLGDVRDRQQGHQSIGRLSHEVAYEHWHRMLFARFLAENGLLIHPDHRVAMSARDIEDLANEMGNDAHELAAGFAQDLLPQIFRTGDPVLEVTLAPETRQKLEALLDSLPPEVFTADDSLGWTYQYWQAEKKDAVNASGEKIGADELPAVTQLFTEHYMVMFLYHNTVGAWHAGKVIAENPILAETAQSEDELRSAVAFKTGAGDSNWEYLRFVRQPQDGDEYEDPTGPWRPAAGTFDGWPKKAGELKVLDPCCGSGHFLVSGFKLLTQLRMLEDGLGLEEAINAVLEENIYGLELDPRCTQIAAFNLAIAAWKLVGRPIELPPLNIACSGLSISSSKKDWLALAGADERLGAGLSNLYELFRQAPELGSLIDPKSLSDDMFVADFKLLKPLLEQALAKESNNEEIVERAVAAQGMAKAANLLAGEYTLVITNVPYLGQRDQGTRLRRYCLEHYKASKADLATVFLERLIKILHENGAVAAVMPQNWLFLKRYQSLREKLLSSTAWNLIARLGPKAFQTPMWDFNVMLLILTAQRPNCDESISGIDVAKLRHPADKATELRGKNSCDANESSGDPLIRLVSQLDQLKQPDAAVSFSPLSQFRPLSEFAYCYQGASTIDVARFRLHFWEIRKTADWNLHLSTPKEGKLFSGYHYVSARRDPGSPMYEIAQHMKAAGFLGGWLSGNKVWGKRGIACSWMNELPATPYNGAVFDNMAAVIIPNDEALLGPIWAFCSSEDYNSQVRQINQKLQVANATLVKVPFDIKHWQQVAAKKWPAGLPEPQSDDPTQWLFHGHPAKAELAASLQVAVGRLLGYRWPPELDSDIRLDGDALNWVARCDELEGLADDDGIVCLPAIRSELPAASRLRGLLATAFGSEWSVAKEAELLNAAAGKIDRPVASLDAWLRDKFFEEHCKLFQHRPFVWHIWDGNQDGFHCLVNAHKLTGPDGEGRRTLEAIAYSYLGDWIQRQKDNQKTMVEGADARLAAAQDLQQQLVEILQGEPPYDLFVRWKPLNEQAIGWEPDINDGVRLNIRPFMNSELRKGGKKGAGLLRWKPNIKWKKDRGKEPESLRPMDDFPWFWGCNGNGSTADRTDYTAERAGKAKFDGNRWNDLHYTRAVKEAARAAVEKQSQDTNK